MNEENIVRYLGSGFNKTKELREEGYLVYPTTDKFGLIIPRKTGVVFRHQVSGCLCKKEYLEGVYLPLNKVNLYCREYSLDRSLTNLVKENYPGFFPEKEGHPLGSKKAQNIWEDVKDSCRLDFKVLRGKEPPNQEGWVWVRITKSNHGLECYDDLVGKEVVLVYPNSD